MCEILRHLFLNQSPAFWRGVQAELEAASLSEDQPATDPTPLQRSIALLIETSSTYGRQILRGIHRFIQQQDQQEWMAVLEERDLNAGTPDWIQNWRGDGIISRQTTVDLQNELKANDVAFVELNDRSPTDQFTVVRSDDVMIGQLAAEHLSERGLGNFAFCGFENESWSDRRREGFANHVDSVGGKYFQLQSDWYARDVKLWQQEQRRLTAWLEELPKPIGILACNDIRGKQLIDCCYQAKIEVPESVAVVGVDNDELLCSFSRTPMSSVIPNAERIGYRSAQLLAGMMADPESRHSVQEILIPPLGVFSRRSSDIVAVDDRELAVALRYIRHHASEGISVSDVVKVTGMSRSTLERKMRNFISRSPQQEIRRVQLKQVCRLLAATDLSIESVAIQCGFDHPEYLHVVFKRELGMTPGEYRAQAERL